MKPYNITIKGLSGTVTEYTGMYHNSVEAVRDAVFRMDEIGKLIVRRA